MRNRILKALSLAFCLFATNAVAQTTGAVVSISSAPTVGGSCYTGMAVYVVQSTGDGYTCISGSWFKIVNGYGSSGSADWVKKGIDWDADGTYPALEFKRDVGGTTDVLQTDLDGDTSVEFSLIVEPGDNFFFYIGEGAIGARSYWTPTSFVGAQSLGMYAKGSIVVEPDMDNSTGDTLDLKTAWSGGNPYTTFRFSGTSLTFEGAADDANQVDFTPATLTGTRTVTVPDKSGGLVLLNGTTYPSPASPVCAEWQTDGRLGIAASNAACGGSGGSGDDVTIDGTDVGGSGVAVQFGVPSGETNDIDFGFTNGTPDIIFANVRDNTITSAKIVNSTITGNDIANTTITGAKLANNTIDATQLATSIAMGTNDLFSFAATDMDATNTEGFILPQATSCPTTGPNWATEGSVCWDKTTDILYIGTGSARTSASGDVTSVWNCNTLACNGLDATASTMWVRPGLNGIVGARYSLSNINENSNCPNDSLGGSSAGDLLVDLSDNQIFACNAADQLQLLGGAGGSGISTTQEDDSTEGSSQLTMDFGAGLDLSVTGTESDVTVDIGEVGLTANSIWMGQGAGTHGGATNKAISLSIPNCYAANEKLSYRYGLLNDEDQVWSCDILSTTASADTLDYNKDGVDPILKALSNSSFTADFDGTHNTSPEWEMHFTLDSTYGPSVLARTIFQAEDPVDCPGAPCCLPAGNTNPACYMPVVNLGTPIRRFNEVRADHFYGAVHTFSMVNAVGDVVAAFGTDETGSVMKFFLNSNLTTPALQVVAGGIDADGDGVADNLTQNGLNKSMPNYNESFTSQTTVVLDHYLATPNLVTVCYDGSDNQITPSSVAIGTAPAYDVTVTFSGPTTGRCVVNGGANNKFTTSFSSQIAVVVDHDDLGMDPYAAHVTCYDNADPRNRVEPDSVQIDDTTLDMTINFAVGQSGRCVVS